MIDIKILEREELKNHFLENYGSRTWITHKGNVEEFYSPTLIEDYEDAGKATVCEMSTLEARELSRIMVVIDLNTPTKRIYLDRDTLPLFNERYWEISKKSSEFYTSREDVKKLASIINIMEEERGYVFYRAKGELD